jgi:hypothetical protein
MATNSQWQRERRMLAAEMAASRRLGRKIQQLLWKKVPTFDSPSFEFTIALILFLRAERTFASIRSLARTNMVDDAMALVRVMVEKVINAKFIYFSGTDTALDYVQYLAFRSWRDYEEMEAVSPELVPNYSEEERKEMRAASENAKLRTLPNGSQKNRFGRGSDWVDSGLKKRAEFVDEALTARFNMRRSTATQILYLSAYKKSAGYLHGTWISTARSLEFGTNDGTVDSDGLMQLSLGVKLKDSDPRVAIEAMNIANLTAMALVLFIAKAFGQERDLAWCAKFTIAYKEELRNAKIGVHES